MTNMIVTALRVLGPRAIAKIALLLLEYLAKRTDNRVDDNIIATVKTALEQSEIDEY